MSTGYNKKKKANRKAEPLETKAIRRKIKMGILPAFHTVKNLFAGKQIMEPSKIRYRHGVAVPRGLTLRQRNTLVALKPEKKDGV